MARIACCISIDFISDPVLGDVGCPQILDVWLKLIAAGIALFRFGGPPCESWRAARGRWLPFVVAVNVLESFAVSSSFGALTF